MSISEDECSVGIPVIPGLDSGRSSAAMCNAFLGGRFFTSIGSAVRPLYLFICVATSPCNFIQLPGDM